MRPPQPGYSDRIGHAIAFAAKHAVASIGRGAGAANTLITPTNVAVILARHGAENLGFHGRVIEDRVVHVIDGLLEQAVHTVDWLAWAMKDEPPVSCTAVGGRQIPAQGGNIFDHIEANYQWEDGTLGFVAQRQIPGCHNENFLTVIGTKGIGRIDGRGVSITGENAWRHQGEKPDMYQVEHNELFASIRAGKPINDGDRMAKSTLMGIMGRTAAYTGQQITWEAQLASKQVLVPEIKDWNSVVDVQPMALPGRTKFV